MNKIDYFQQELAEGRTPSDPFQDATERVSLSEEQKEALRRAWNNQIMNLFGGEEILRNRMLARHVRRATRYRY